MSSKNLIELPMYFLDAFTTEIFKGNPAAVCPLTKWLPDQTLQAIAAENNLAETAFFIAEEDGYHLRWFTPTVEVDLCGHATLASAHVLFNHLGYKKNQIRFRTLSGNLFVSKNTNDLTLDFPGRTVRRCEPTKELLQLFKTAPRAFLESGSATYIVVLDSEDEVRNFQPDMAKIALVDRCVNITARGKNCDFVSRFFGPQVGIPEDPVTGSAHCGLAIYWAQELGKNQDLHAIQVSARTGEIYCSVKNDRVHLSGAVVEYMKGTIQVPLFYLDSNFDSSN